MTEINDSLTGGGTFEFFNPEFSEMNVSVIKFPRWTKWSIFTLHVKPLDKIIQMFQPDQREGVYSTYDNWQGHKLHQKHFPPSLALDVELTSTT